MDKIRIKKHRNRNDYILSKNGMWVRDFTKPLIKGVDINNLISIPDMQIMLENEMRNHDKLYQKIETEDFHYEKIVIIGDGYQCKEKQKLLENLPNDVLIFGVNKAFAAWDCSRRLNYYIVNNPYEECLFYYPPIVKSWPKCLASTRVYPDFIKHYKGTIYLYNPVVDEIYSGVKKEVNYFVDDYRNPVCAAICLAYKFKVKKLLLMSILDLYETERPGTEKHNDLWIYPQQKTAHSIIDANLYWLQKAKISVVYNDSGPDYEFATYINDSEVKGYFNAK
jgi:hypothetical protein